MNIHIATLFTELLEEPGSLAVGNFSVEIDINYARFAISPDKQGFVKHEVAIHLAQAILDTEVPQQYWRCNFNPDYARDLNFPLQMVFK